MARNPDSMATVYDSVLANASLTDPWTHGFNSTPSYAPAYHVFERLLTAGLRHAGGSETGIFPKGIDLWLSYELRRAGFLDGETWPRRERPRVLARELAILLEKLPTRSPNHKGLNLRDEVRRRINEISAITPTEAVVLGRAYDKQVDVCIARWDRGPELLVSTKAQLSSFGKNLPNRFEEAVGDAANLTSRYPLAAVGYFFVQRATILTAEPETYERTKDMMRKLRSGVPGLGYTATGLCLVDWDDDMSADDRSVRVLLDPVPQDLRPDRFLTAMIEQVLTVTPIAHHVGVRRLYERRDLPIPLTDPLGEGLAPEDAAVSGPED